MKKKAWLVIPLVILIVAGGLFAYYRYAMRLSGVAAELAHDLAQAAIEGNEIESNLAVHVGVTTRENFQELRERFLAGYVVSVTWPFGDREAQYHVIIETAGGSHLITLRVKYDGSLGRFHILGLSRRVVHPA